MLITKNKISEIKSYLIKNLSPERYKHSVSTAKTAAELCRKFGLEEEKGFLAGLIHDIAREYGNKEIIDICMEKGEDISDWELETPVFLHGKAGAAVVKEKFGLYDEDILDAVRFHTTGCPKMRDLSKVLFIADYIEPCRKHISPEYIKSLETKSMDEMLETVLLSIIDYFKRRGIKAADKTMELLEELKL